ncbi:hypothetical protein TB1_033808 [Malus domestica]
MQGRQSLNLALIPIDHELERTLQNHQRKYLSQGEVQAFYEGLNNSNKAIVDSTCKGMLMKMSYTEAIEMYEELVENSQQFNTRGR